MNVPHTIMYASFIVSPSALAQEIEIPNQWCPLHSPSGQLDLNHHAHNYEQPENQKTKQ